MSVLKTVLSYAHFILECLAAIGMCFVSAVMLLWGVTLRQWDACVLGSLLGVISIGALVHLYRGAAHG